MPRGHQSGEENHGAFLFGDWLVEPELSRLRKDEQEVRLELKVMDVLVHLARHGSRVVTRQQLIDAVWDGGFISDNTLTHAVAELRRALGDCSTDPSYIETIHRRGYRLIKPVTDLEGRPPLGFGRPSRFRVLVEDRNVQLREGENLIGRVPGASLCIHSLQVSRRHAQIIVENNRAYVEDLDSKNGTLLNGRPLEGRRRLANGDRIFLGESSVVLQFIEAGNFAPTDPPDVVTPTEPLMKA
jgi:DNA-binding winged helix-turn-helix (wHTH) protein